MDGLLEAAAEDRSADGPWLALIAELKRRGDVRAELAEIQLALENARGPERRDLLFAEEKLLRDRPELWGPLGELAAKPTVAWRRGFLDALVVPGASVTSFPDGRRVRNELLPREVLSRVVEHDVARLCRYVYAYRKPKRAPTWTERLDLARAVITRDVMALPRLRELRVWSLVSSAPLRHRALEHVALPDEGPVLELLESAELPGLKSLSLTQLGRTAAEPARLAAAVARLAPERLYLAFGGVFAHFPWSADAVRELAPVADRITGLGITVPMAPLELQLPHLRRLSVAVSVSPGTVGSDKPLPALPAADELHLITSGMDRGAMRGSRGGLGIAERAKEIVESRALQSARILQLDAADVRLATIFDQPLERLEELSIAPQGTRHIDLSDAVFAKESFPNVRIVSLAFPEQLAGLARSPLAAQIETLSLGLGRPENVTEWLELREKFPKLQTLVMRRGHGLDAETRIRIEATAPNVIWARTNPETTGAMFDGERTEPGFAWRHG